MIVNTMGDLTKIRRFNMGVQIFNPWDTASEVIGNKYCLNPKVVKKVLFKLDSRCNMAFMKAMTMAETELDKFIAMVLKEA